MKKSASRKKSAPPRFKEKQFDCNAVIFDMDNVLIDTRRSYLDTIRWTVEIYLTEGNLPLFKKDLPKDKTVVSLKDIDRFKLLGGFNDDWDCCYGLLVYLLSLPAKKRTTSELKRLVNIQDFAAKIRLRPLGVPQIVALLGRPPQILIEKIGRIFQEIYLGKDLFKTVEQCLPLYWDKRGLIRRESLVFPRRLFEKIKKAGIRLGISTGRSRFEADYTLKHFDVFDYFEAITSADEIKKAEASMRKSLRKPNPYSVVQTAVKMGKDLRFIYLGDLPDDVLAANRAKETIEIRSAVYPSLSAEPEAALAEIQKTHPDFIIRNAGDLKALLKLR